jgi:hypothetical protein
MDSRLEFETGVCCWKNYKIAFICTDVVMNQSSKYVDLDR